MKYLSLLMLLICGNTLLAQTKPMTPGQYAEKYKLLALKVMKEHKIPASITLAQGILESNAGSSELAVNAFNHFGLKHSTVYEKYPFYEKKTREIFNGQETFIVAKFTKFANDEDCYMGRVAFLKRSRYASCFECGDSYDCWAKKLLKNGYATDTLYPVKLVTTIGNYKLASYDQQKIDSALISVIQSQNLQELDNPLVQKALTKEQKEAEYWKMKKEATDALLEYNKRMKALKDFEKANGIGDVNAPPTSSQATMMQLIKLEEELNKVKELFEVSDIVMEHGKFKINGLQVAQMRKSDFDALFADRYGLTVEELKKFNELPAEAPLVKGAHYFLQSKKEKYDGLEKIHTVTPEDTWYSISQQYGLTLNTLLSLNAAKADTALGKEVKLKK